MLSDFKLFKKSVKSKNKTIHRWYISYYDAEGKRKQKVCKGCKTLAEATEYVKQLNLQLQKSVTVKEVAEEMFVEGSQHLKRQASLGKTYSQKTIKCYRRFIDLIIERFGDKELEKVEVKEVVSYLMSKDNSGSWKNNFCEVFNMVYAESIWHTDKVIAKPEFPRFARNSKKADILTTEELSRFFNYELWNSYSLYLLFLVTATCGLRIGETRALQKRQIVFESKALVVDGFCKQNGERTNYNKKGSDEDTKLRVVIIPDTVVEMLKGYVESNYLEDDDFLFNKGYNCPYRQEYLESVFKRQLDKAEIRKLDRKLVPHSLRFTYVTRMRRSLDVDTVKKLAGHSSAEMTEYYTRVAIPEMINALQSVRPAANSLFD